MITFKVNTSLKTETVNGTTANNISYVFLCEFCGEGVDGADGVIDVMDNICICRKCRELLNQNNPARGES